MVGGGRVACCIHAHPLHLRHTTCSALPFPCVSTGTEGQHSLFGTLPVAGFPAPKSQNRLIRQQLCSFPHSTGHGASATPGQGQLIGCEVNSVAMASLPTSSPRNQLWWRSVTRALVYWGPTNHHHTREHLNVSPSRPSQLTIRFVAVGCWV